MNRIQLNWSITVIIGIISIIPVCIAFIITFSHYIKNRYQHNLFFMLLWLFNVSWFLLNTLAFLFFSLWDPYLSRNLLGVTIFIFLPIGLMLILVMDSISREYLDYKKLMVWTAIATTTIIFLFDPNQYYILNSNNILYWELTGALEICFSSLFLFYATLYFYYAVRIYLKAPKTLKNSAYLNLISALIQIIILPILMQLVIDGVLVPGFELIGFSIFSLLVSISFGSQPLAFVLPFKVIRLTVIETKGGIRLFSHDWVKMDNIVDEDLFSGMLQAISRILDESLKRGDIREIALENAVLILKRSKIFPVACLLVTSKSTIILKQALNSFAESFFKKYSQFFENFSETSNFNSAIKLIHERFSFVPQYEK